MFQRENECCLLCKTSPFSLKSRAINCGSHSFWSRRFMISDGQHIVVFNCWQSHRRHWTFVENHSQGCRPLAKLDNLFREAVSCRCPSLCEMDDTSIFCRKGGPETKNRFLKNTLLIYNVSLLCLMVNPVSFL